MYNFDIIVAVDKKLGIGKNGKIPWHLKADMGHFKEITSKTTSEKNKNAVIMGRITWDSLPNKFKPLPDRINVVLSRHNQDLQLPKGVIVVPSLDQALDLLAQVQDLEKVFIIGGAQLYKEAIEHPKFEKLYLTRIDGEYGCEVFFPEYEKIRKLVKKTEVFEEAGIKYWFEEWG
jgi:dihydrofolate reductase